MSHTLGFLDVNSVAFTAGFHLVHASPGNSMGRNTDTLRMILRRCVHKSCATLARNGALLTFQSLPDPLSMKCDDVGQLA
jgi:hypothetical protein